MLTNPIKPTAINHYRLSRLSLQPASYNGQQHTNTRTEAYRAHHLLRLQLPLVLRHPQGDFVRRRPCKS